MKSREKGKGSATKTKSHRGRIRGDPRGKRPLSKMTEAEVFQTAVNGRFSDAETDAALVLLGLAELHGRADVREWLESRPENIPPSTLAQMFRGPLDKLLGDVTARSAVALASYLFGDGLDAVVGKLERLSKLLEARPIRRARDLDGRISPRGGLELAPADLVLTAIKQLETRALLNDAKNPKAGKPVLHPVSGAVIEGARIYSRDEVKALVAAMPGKDAKGFVDGKLGREMKRAPLDDRGFRRKMKDVLRIERPPGRPPGKPA